MPTQRYGGEIASGGSPATSAPTPSYRINSGGTFHFDIPETSPKAPNKWNLDDALTLVRALQPDTRRFGYHLALGGGVLNNGHSAKDVDLYFLQLDNSTATRPDPDALLGWLEKMWGSYEDIGGVSYSNEVDLNGIPLPSTSPYVRKVKFNRKGDRIDVFVL